MEKGIFWARKDADGKIELITVKTPCDKKRHSIASGLLYIQIR